jgi:hypothetical protein
MFLKYHPYDEYGGYMKTEKIITILEKILKKSLKDGDYKLALQAIQLLGKEHGLFSANRDLQINFDKMTDGELDRLIDAYQKSPQ